MTQLTKELIIKIQISKCQVCLPIKVTWRILTKGNSKFQQIKRVFKIFQKWLPQWWIINNNNFMVDILKWFLANIMPTKEIISLTICHKWFSNLVLNMTLYMSLIIKVLTIIREGNQIFNMVMSIKTNSIFITNINEVP